MQYPYDPNYYFYAHLLAQFYNFYVSHQFQLIDLNYRKIPQQYKITVVSPDLNYTKASVQDFLQNNTQNDEKAEKLKKRQKQNKKRQSVFESKKNENRNILPNAMHQILSYVQKSHKSENEALKIFQKICPNQQWNVKRYYTYQKNLRDKIHHYLKQDSLKLLTAIYQPKSQIYSIEEQHFYMKVSRILAMKYINQESLALFLTSRRMQSSKKLQHFKNRRQLLKKASSIFQEI